MWQEYTEELYKKDLHNQDNHDGVITHLEPDILECEVKGALESITTNKASGGDGIPVELFHITFFLFSLLLYFPLPINPGGYKVQISVLSFYLFFLLQHCQSHDRKFYPERISCLYYRIYFIIWILKASFYFLKKFTELYLSSKEWLS